MRARLGDRSLFSRLEVPIYLDHAAVSPASDPVLEAMTDAMQAGARLGIGAMHSWLEGSERARSNVASLLGVPSEEVALTGNTSQGVTAVARGLDWQPGDRIVLFRGEFPANVTPWLLAASDFGLEVRWAEAEAFRLDPEAALAELEPLLEGARLVAVSAVQFQTGFAMPLEAIGQACRRHGAELFVDAIQGLGLLPLSADLPIDYLAAGGHKWLMGPLGTGILWARPERWTELRPHHASWLSHQDGLSFLMEGEGLLRYDRPLRTGPASIEGGVANATGHAALAASVGLLLELGLPAIEEHVGRWVDALELGLLERGFTSARVAHGRSGILSVKPAEGDVLGLAGHLRERGASVSTPDGWLRFAPHWPNALDEVPTLLDAIDRG